MSWPFDLPGPEHNPLYRDAVLLSMYERVHGRRDVVPRDADFKRALWHLRQNGLVDWNEATGQPAPVLTGAGWDFAKRLLRA